MRDPNWLLRAIEANDRRTGRLVQLEWLKGVPLTWLQRWWRLPDDPIWMSLSVEPEQASRLQGYLLTPFDFQRFDYWMAAYRIDADPAAGELTVEQPLPIAVALDNLAWHQRPLALRTAQESLGSWH